MKILSMAPHPGGPLRHSSAPRDAHEDVVQRRARHLEVMDRGARGEAVEKRLRIARAGAPPGAARSR